MLVGWIGLDSRTARGVFVVGTKQLVLTRKKRRPCGETTAPATYLPPVPNTRTASSSTTKTLRRVEALDFRRSNSDDMSLR
jgi:hypothetical protein